VLDVLSWTPPRASFRASRICSHLGGLVTRPGETFGLDEAKQIARELADCPRAERADRFFARIRDSRIPYLACRPSPDPEALFRETFQAIFVLGHASIPLAVALTMHQYVVSALATIPLREPRLRAATDRLLEKIEERRLLLAIGSVGPSSVVVEEGTATGRTDFCSLASRADLLGFIGARAGGELGFYVVETDQPGLRFGDRVFSGAMADADTRRVELDGVPIHDRCVMTDDDVLTRLTMFYGTAWFEGLICAAYLGGAARALDEATSFARGISLPGGTDLSDLDGTHVELGRMAVQLDAALALSAHVARSIASIERAVEAASIAKYTSTRAAEEIVQSVRRFIGTRAMAEGSTVLELSEQILFGPLHPRVSATFERDHGKRLLSRDSMISRSMLY
jgi:alkylation response protein AidB-like acyl-CoA dehydrogenase